MNQKQFEEKVINRSKEIMETIRKEEGRTFTVEQGFPYLVARMAKIEVELEIIAKLLKKNSVDRLIAKMFLSDEGNHGNS